ncbi:M14 family metallopeptidase [Leeuwenhoekiella marinoflava]|uniref:Zinc carboxypeptidase n=2 Tax=Leeuwenhoekiella marinoflava TaxID=988 RepID=A0A4Q0PKU8_9FLAO|nr:M14 family metallopeptidase [Leeuwenhoekiella marinoflava]RXG29023.1 zinc carboxypeptidase [Leeuwenhoekiella marinoflava]SHF45751.1 Zinc carboxypeptidase [Leeuwenhoekiella marinoflava DSM 3653]
MYKFTLLITLLFTTLSFSQSLQSPEEFLGYKIGTEFSRHADVVSYFEYVAANSDWVTYQEYGKTNERRSLTYAIVTNPENQANIETIRTNQLKNAGIEDGSANPDKAIVWLSYNVHGNEASSTEASMLTLYELITTRKEWLQNTVVIIDPCINPDGRDRYTNWYNKVKATPYDTNPDAAEHNEPWPGGRANHYLFDLNRDWAWATQKETRQRLKVYNSWLPHIHVDFHEQGINNPYYFAPAAEPYHQIITPFQFQFQKEIGTNHAKYFDQNGWLFFTREVFDLLYPSYGDTYPTYTGSIGMTYEQAGGGRAGLGIKKADGTILTLVDRVAHHFTTGISTVEMAANNVDRLNSEFKKYYSNSDVSYKNFTLTGESDHLAALAELLDTHSIEYSFALSGTTSGYKYTSKKQGKMSYDQALVVSTDQPKGKLVHVLFEPEAALSTPLTYDITAWSLPYAYGLEAVASTKANSETTTVPLASERNTMSKNAAGYISKWNSMEDAKFLSALLQANIKVRFSEKAFTNSGIDYPNGSLIITRSDNNSTEFDSELITIANQFKRKLTAVQTSFASAGPDFGSSSVKLINKAKIAVLSGEQTSSLSYGATWHFFEQQLKYPVTSILAEDLSRVNLTDYDVLVLPSGRYRFDEGSLDLLKSWVRGGGNLIAIDNALKAFSDKDGFALKESEPVKEEDTIVNKLIPYAERESSRATELISGSIFKTQIDNTHPLAFGYNTTYYTLKIGSDAYALLDKGYNVAYLTDNPESVSGYAGENALKALENSLVFGVEPMGRGSLTYMVDDPLFRAFWQNGKLFFVNALFLNNPNNYRD